MVEDMDEDLDLEQLLDVQGEILQLEMLIQHITKLIMDLHGLLLLIVYLTQEEVMVEQVLQRLD